MKCIKCQKELSNDEIGLHKKLVNRGAKEFMCMNCLGKYFKITPSQLEEKIMYFKNSGCTLFK